VDCLVVVRRERELEASGDARFSKEQPCFSPRRGVGRCSDSSDAAVGAAWAQTPLHEIAQLCSNRHG
jgi:hypothetical protein